ncbi:hypothetical protein MTP03_30600 [Tsukamurella sp. PLM1]|nr:hypothetical protein MTP03_30600 [Tsukamurella sp. PLM1]
MALTLVLGGVRSGKSARAEQLIGSGPVRYVATAPRPDGDPDLAARVAAHRSRRPQSWSTVETQDVTAVLAEGNAPTLVDDLGGWLAARLDRTGWETPENAGSELDALVAASAAYAGDLVLVSPEVGLSIVPATHSGRVFQDLLGALNARLAAIADRVELVVAGLVVPLDGAPLPQSAPSPAKPAAAAAVAAQTGSAPADPDLPPVELPPFEPGSDPLAFGRLTPPDAAAAHRARDRQQQLTKPAGSWAGWSSWVSGSRPARAHVRRRSSSARGSWCSRAITAWRPAGSRRTRRRSPRRWSGTSPPAAPRSTCSQTSPGRRCGSRTSRSSAIRARPPTRSAARRATSR